MEHDFWHERWNNDEIFFNQPKPHRHLRKHWSKLKVAPGSNVFVPLCGKTIDMMWLSEAGHRVIGNELSEIAVKAFFAENDLPAETRTEGEFTVYRGAEHELWCGDFFKLNRAALADVDVVFDRASLVALPPEMRADFAAHLTSILPTKAVIFQLTFIYDQTEMPGRPTRSPPMNSTRCSAPTSTSNWSPTTR